MMGRQDRAQLEFTISGPLREFVPDDHILVRVDEIVDLSWVREEVAGLYCLETGRPSVDPEVMMRLMLSGMFLGIMEDRKLMREAQVNLAIRWFCGYELHDRLPDHSTLTRTRQRWGEGVFKEVFERTIEMCIEAGLVDGSTVHVDATLMRANASMESFARAHVEAVLEANPEPVEADPTSVEATVLPVDAEPGPMEVSGEVERAGSEGEDGSTCSKSKKVSQTDPDAALVRNKRGDKCRPAYKVHAVVDDRAGVVVSAHVTRGDVWEGGELLCQLDDAEQNVGRRIETAAADGGYSRAQNYGALERRGVQALIPSQPPSGHRGGMHAFRFKYDEHNDVVRCPEGRKLYRCREGRQGVTYKARVNDCERCPVRERCVPPKSKVRTILVVKDHGALVRARRAQWRGEIREHPTYRRRFWCAEGIFAWGKRSFGLARAARRGLTNVSVQVYAGLAAMNLSRLVRRTGDEAYKAFAACLWAFCAALERFPGPLQGPKGPWDPTCPRCSHIPPRGLIPTPIQPPGPAFSTDP